MEAHMSFKKLFLYSITSLLSKKSRLESSYSFFTNASKYSKLYFIFSESVDPSSEV